MRTENWCRLHGLVYTGISSRIQTVCEVRCKELRDKGYMAYVARWKPDPLSRSGGTGYSVYAEKRWKMDEEEKRITIGLAEIPARIQLAYRELEMELEKIEKMKHDLECELAGLRVKQMGGPW